MYKPKHFAEPEYKHYSLAIVVLVSIALVIVGTSALLIGIFKAFESRPRQTAEVQTMDVVLFTDVPEVTVEYTTEKSSADEAFADDLDLLARLIHAEAGSGTCSDDLQKYVGSVALNRVRSEYYPNNLYDVVYQEEQYECVMNGKINEPATDREIRMAKWLYSVGPQLPQEVVFQAEFIQGDGIYLKEQNMYFCYVGEITTGETVYVE